MTSSGSLAVALARGDNYVLSTVTSPSAMTTAPEIRGDTWLECKVWYQTMPGSFFQCFCVFLCLAFMGSGKNSVAALYLHVMCACAFFFLAIWAIVDSCAADIVIWSFVILFVNVGQIIYITYKSKQTEKVFDGKTQAVYLLRFSPFEISPETFVDLVTCKGCEMLTLSKGHNYAAEGKTPIEKLSLLVSGKIRVSRDNKVLHYVKPNEFIDSPEWQSLKSSNNKSTYKVTITAEADCKYITWKRKPLLSLLAKRKRLGKLMNHMIGRDIVNKLYLLNNTQFNQRGFRYDIRLPLIMSLRDDVMEREKRKKDSALGMESPAGRRHKKMGKMASEHYTALFARRMSQRLGLMNRLKDKRPSGAAEAHEKQ